MKKEILYKMSSPYRDDFRIYGYRFGSGHKSVAVVGALRGDELEQQYACAALVRELTELESNGGLVPDFEILVIPSVNPSSMNIGKRFFSMDNTDINRMFPGYDKGETTQRIAHALFENIKDYEYGVQMASYYISGEFIPHVRMLDTGFQPQVEAKYFGLPYVYVKEVSPYDTAMLNYNWQIWQTKAFSLYTGHTSQLDMQRIDTSLRALLRFMTNIGAITIDSRPGYLSEVISSADLTSVVTTTSGLLRCYKSAQCSVKSGEVVAQVVDPYNASILETITSPVDGVVFFSQDNPLVKEGARAFQIIEDRMI